MRSPEEANSQSESKVVGARGWGRGRRGSSCVMGREFQFCKMT